MQWVLIGETDVTAHGGRLYLIDGEYTPHVNEMEGRGPQALAGSQETADPTDDEPRRRAADICARHAGLPPGGHEFADVWWRPEREDRLAAGDDAPAGDTPTGGTATTPEGRRCASCSDDIDDLPAHFMYCRACWRRDKGEDADPDHGDPDFWDGEMHRLITGVDD